MTAPVPERFLELAYNVMDDAGWNEHIIVPSILAPVLADIRRQVNQQRQEAIAQRDINGDETGDDGQRLAYWMWTEAISTWDTMGLILDGFEVAEL